jgi:hypothetical protein
MFNAEFIAFIGDLDLQWGYALINLLQIENIVSEKCLNTFNLMTIIT